VSSAKGLLLGFAAGLFVVAGVKAADVPFKGKPVEYVKVCSLSGAGFLYIPGTGTCIKLGGAARAESNTDPGGIPTTAGRQNFSYAITDADVWSVLFPVQRNAWP
jgi:Porin subfamily